MSLGVMHNRPMKRIAHVDGLRAIAVIAVLFFHVGLAPFGGGFVGVDVFFVISGYVITRMIVRDLDGGAFDIRLFYVSRAQRLLPALLVTLSLSLLGSAVLLTPQHLMEAGWSFVWAIAGLSNIFFWSIAGYFDTASFTKPALHTWTLSVEWQFYAVWPMFLFLVWRAKHRTPVWIAFVGLASLAANIVAGDRPSLIFYWMPFRVFEFAIGALLVWAPRPIPRWYVNPLTAIGLLLIVFPVYGYRADILFPSVNALPPVLGAALVVWAGGSASLGRIILANPVIAYLGRISYSVYLVHWPIIVFTSYHLNRPLSPLEGLVIAASSVAIGATLYHAVELPFWKGGAKAYTAHLTGIVATLLIATSLSSVSAGWLWRLTPEAQAAGKMDKGQLLKLWGRSNCRKPCQYGNEGANKTVLVMGDSHADHFARALLDRIGETTRFLHLHGGSCFFGADLENATDKFNSCDEANAKKREWIAEADVVVHAQRWSGYMELLSRRGERITFSRTEDLFEEEFADLEKLYQDFPGTVILVNATPSARMSCLSLPQIMRIDCRVPHMEDNALFAEMARRFVEGHPKFRFINPADYLCEGNACQIMDEHQRLLYVDDSGHLSYYGARRVVPFIAREIDQAPSRADSRASKPAATKAQSSS